MAVDSLCPSDQRDSRSRVICSLSPPKGSFYLPSHEGKLPINERELQSSVWPSAQGPWASREGVVALDGNWKQMQEMRSFFIIIFVDSPPSPLYSPPLSQIWTFTEMDFMPGLPVNSLNSIVGPLSAPGVMSCFRSPGEAKGWVHLPSAGGGHRRRGVGTGWTHVLCLLG